MTTRFTTDNTEGYSQADLDKLNMIHEELLSCLALRGIDIEDKSLQDHTAEQVLASYDRDHQSREAAK
jgi:hypothetical protein